MSEQYLLAYGLLVLAILVIVVLVKKGRSE